MAPEYKKVTPERKKITDMNKYAARRNRKGYKVSDVHVYNASQELRRSA